MPDARALAIDIHDVQKDYRALRPLRLRALEVHEGEAIALLGFDRGAAEVFVNLVTAATVPDTGEIRVFGRLTAAITDANAWLTSLDGFGILSERAVVLDNMTVEENLTMPLTMALHDIDPAVRTKVNEIAAEVGIAASDFGRPVAALNSSGLLRLRLGRALAPDPRILLAEHPNAMLEPPEVARFAADYSRIVSRRRIASVVLTTDSTFASAVAPRVLTLQPATGELAPRRSWRGLLGRQ